MVVSPQHSVKKQNKNEQKRKKLKKKRKGCSYKKNYSWRPYGNLYRERERERNLDVISDMI